MPALPHPAEVCHADRVVAAAPRLIAGCGPGTAGPEVRRAVLAVAWDALDSCPRPRPDAWAPEGATGRYREILASRPGGWPNGWMRLEFLGTVVRSIEMAQGE